MTALQLRNKLARGEPITVVHFVIDTTGGNTDVIWGMSTKHVSGTCWTRILESTLPAHTPRPLKKVFLIFNTSEVNKIICWVLSSFVGNFHFYVHRKRSQTGMLNSRRKILLWSSDQVLHCILFEFFIVIGCGLCCWNLNLCSGPDRSLCSDWCPFPGKAYGHQVWTTPNFILQGIKPPLQWTFWLLKTSQLTSITWRMCQDQLKRNL